MVNEQANTRLVQQAYQQIGTGDLQGFLNSLAVDVQWQIPKMENVPFAGLWQGRDGVEKFFSIVDRTQEVIEFEPKEFIAQSESVVVLGHFSQRIKATSRKFTSDWAHVWTVNNGKITHFREYVDTAVVSRAYSAAQAGYGT